MGYYEFREKCFILLRIFTGICAIYEIVLFPLFIFWATTNFSNLVLGKVIKETFEKYVPALAFILYFIRTDYKNTKLTRFLILLCLSIAMFGFINLLYYGNLFYFLGMKWQYSAIIVWSLSYAVLLWFLQKHYSFLHTLILSYSIILVSSIVYELPWILANDRLYAIITSPKFYIPLATITNLTNNHLIKTTKMTFFILSLIILAYFCFQYNLKIPFYNIFVRIPYPFIFITFEFKKLDSSQSL